MKVLSLLFAITLLLPLTVQAQAPLFTILFLGDSLTEGYGLDDGQSFPDLIAKRFSLAVNRLGLNKERPWLRKDIFTPPVRQGAQFDLFRDI